MEKRELKWMLVIIFVVLTLSSICYLAETTYELKSNFKWDCVETEVRQNWTVVENFDTWEYCDKLHCETQEMAEEYLNKTKPSHLECFEKCLQQHEAEIKEKKKPHIKFYNETYCVKEKLKVKDKYKIVDYKV